MSPRVEKALEQTRVAIEQMDFSSEDAEVARLEKEIAEIETARENALARRQEIVEALRVKPEVTAHAIADQLLAGGVRLGAVAPAPSDLEHERDALADGLRELAARARSKNIEIREVQRKAQAAFGRTVAPLVDAIVADAHQAAEQLRDCALSLAGLARIANIPGNASKAVEIAAGGLFGDPYSRGLLPISKDLPIPAEIVALLRGVRETKALKAVVIETANITGFHSIHA